MTTTVEPELKLRTRYSLLPLEGRLAPQAAWEEVPKDSITRNATQNHFPFFNPEFLLCFHFKELKSSFLFNIDAPVLHKIIKWTERGLN